MIDEKKLRDEFDQTIPIYSRVAWLTWKAAHAKYAPRCDHPDDEAVDAFAAAMKEKLAKKRSEGRSGWNDHSLCSQALLSQMLHDHCDKGDPVDVANFAMMLHQRGESIAPRWLPIDEAAKDGWAKFGMKKDKSSVIAYWDEGWGWFDMRTHIPVELICYMPIPDAPEVG